MTINGIFDITNFDESHFYITQLAPTDIVVTSNELNVIVSIEKIDTIGLSSTDAAVSSIIDSNEQVDTVKQTNSSVTNRKNVSIVFSQ